MKCEICDGDLRNDPDRSLVESTLSRLSEILENLVDTFGRHGPEGAKLRNVGDEQLRNAVNHPGQFF